MCYAMLCCAMLWYTTLCYTVLYYHILYYTVLWCVGGQAFRTQHKGLEGSFCFWIAGLNGYSFHVHQYEESANYESSTLKLRGGPHGPRNSTPFDLRVRSSPTLWDPDAQLVSWPHDFCSGAARTYTIFVASRVIISCYMIRHFWTTTCVRQVVVRQAIHPECVFLLKSQLIAYVFTSSCQFVLSVYSNNITLYKWFPLGPFTYTLSIYSNILSSI